VIARLREGVSAAQAQAEIGAIGQCVNCARSGGKTELKDRI
jgi:hypothetical protein